MSPSLVTESAKHSSEGRVSGTLKPWLLTDSSRILGSPSSRIIHSLYSTIVGYIPMVRMNHFVDRRWSKPPRYMAWSRHQPGCTSMLNANAATCPWKFVTLRAKRSEWPKCHAGLGGQHGEIAKTFGYHEIDWRILKAMLPKSRCLPLGAFLNTSSGRGVNLQDLRDLSWETYPVPNDITDLVDWSIICHLIFAEGSQKKLVWGLQHHLKQKVLVSKKYAWESRLQALSTGITCNSYVQLRYTRNIPWVASWPWARFARNWLVPTPVAGSGLPPTRRTAATAARNATGAMSLGSRELIGCW